MVNKWLIINTLKYPYIITRTLENLCMNKVFICPSAVSLKYGIRDYSHEQTAVQQCAIESGDEVYILANSRKFEKKALLKLDNMNPGYTYITDSSLNEGFLKLYDENGIKVISK